MKKINHVSRHLGWEGAFRPDRLTIYAVARAERYKTRELGSGTGHRDTSLSKN